MRACADFRAQLDTQSCVHVVLDHDEGRCLAVGAAGAVELLEQRADAAHVYDKVPEDAPNFWKHENRLPSVSSHVTNKRNAYDKWDLSHGSSEQ